MVEANSNIPIAGLTITATNGSSVGKITQSSEDGSFKITVTYNQLNNGYYLLFTADSLYAQTIISLPNNQYGLTEYDLNEISIEGPTLPIIVTDTVSGISKTSAICGGIITDNGRSAIRCRGICWNATHQPTIVNNHKDAVMGGTSHFNILMEDLTPGQKYYVRAYAFNSLGIAAYGQEESFTTPTGAPEVTTNAATNVTQHGARLSGVVSTDYGDDITERGICYSSTSQNPTINDQKKGAGTGLGSFFCDIDNLQSGTKYFFCAYAININGVGYGETRSFTTF